MNHICPYCEKETRVEKVKISETYTIKNEKISIPVEVFKCLECNQTFDDPLSSYDPVKVAYDEYRSRKGMIQPDEIRAYRKRYGLTQNELSTLLGWGGATLSRYENGALQDATHENMLRLMMEPRNLLRLVTLQPEVLPLTKKQAILKELEEEENSYRSLKSVYELRLSNYSPDISSGYLKLNMDKVFNAIIFFCAEGVLKTKLNKLLFYADFKYFKEHSTSITGLRYAKLDHGPVPDNYEHFFAFLQHEEKTLKVEEEPIYNYIGEVLSAEIGPNLSCFTKDELKTLEAVKKYFKDFNAKEIRDYSHKERGYIETDYKEFIPYSFAEYLQI